MLILPKTQSYLRPVQDVSGVNWDHPLTDGLIALHAHTGTWARDLVTGQAGSPTTAPPALATHPVLVTGAACTAASSQDYRFDRTAVSLAGLSNATLIVWCERTADTDDLTFANWVDATNQRRTMIQWEDSTFYGQVENGDFSGRNVTLAATNRGAFLLGMSYDGGGVNNDEKVKLYVQGAKQSTGDTVGPIPTTLPALNRTAWQSDYNSGVQRYFTGRVYVTAAWARTLSPGEHWALFDPAQRWDMFAVPSRRVYFDVGAAVAGQPIVKRYAGIPFMRRGGTTFGQGWNW